MTSLAKKGVKCSEVEEARWGSITKMRLPGGGEVGLYQPKHPTVLEAFRIEMKHQRQLFRARSPLRGSVRTQRLSQVKILQRSVGS